MPEKTFPTLFFFFHRGDPYKQGCKSFQHQLEVCESKDVFYLCPFAHKSAVRIATIIGHKIAIAFLVVTRMLYHKKLVACSPLS